MIRQYTYEMEMHEETRQAIRRQYALGITMAQICNLFGLYPSEVYEVIRDMREALVDHIHTPMDAALADYVCGRDAESVAEEHGIPVGVLLRRVAQIGASA